MMEEKKVAEQAPQATSKKWILGVIGGGLLGFVVLVIFLPEPYYTEGFKTLSELQEYAKTIDEDIKMDGDNYFFPSYESYYKTKFGFSWRRAAKEKFLGLLYRFRLLSRPLFSSSFFKTILLDVMKERQRRGWVGDFVQKIEMNPDSRIVVFGAVQGSFHPLVRYLEKLKELSILDENLTIRDPNDYIVFLGNVINRSPYTLEILSIVLRLLKQNPDNVIYLKNTNEFFEYWEQHTMRRELEIRLRNLSKSKVPLMDEVRMFFETLPLELFCTMPFVKVPSDKRGYFKCMPCPLENEKNKLLDDIYFDSFLQTKFKNKVDCCLVNQGVKKPEMDVKTKLLAIIKDIRKRDAYEIMDGLRLLDPINGVTTWTVMSSTQETYRNFLGFFFDAFLVIERINKEYANSVKVVLYNRDIRNKQKMQFKSKAYDFFTGLALDN